MSLYQSSYMKSDLQEKYGFAEMAMEHLREHRLESAVAVMKKHTVVIEAARFDPIIESLSKQARRLSDLGDVREANHLLRLNRAIIGLRDHGPDPVKMISRVDLSLGYNGKILLVSISGGEIEQLICLRSGDDWHHAILHNAEQEIDGLGFKRSIVNPLGGAWVRFSQSGQIFLHGSSDEFGTCDKTIAAGLISEKFPDHEVLIR